MYFITFSEMIGTNGDKIAKQTAATVGYTYFGEEELVRVSHDMGFLYDVKKLDEKGPSFFERLFSEKPRIYLDRLQSVIYEAAKKGDTVFFGRGSQLMLKSFECALHVLVTGSPEKRIARVMEENHVDRAVAEKIIERSDHDRSGFIRFAYSEDWLDPRLYDLILNTDKMSVNSAAMMVVDAAKSDEIKACGIDSVHALGKLSLQRKIESALLEAGALNPHLFVTVEEMDLVRIFGVAGSNEEKQLVEKTVRTIPGVKRVENDITVWRSAMTGA
jgi:cytidylate kinase